MAISRSSSKTESWTVRIPNELAIAIRDKFSPGTGNTEIVLESIKSLLGIDSTVPSNLSSTVIQTQLDLILARLDNLEKNNNNQPVASSPAALTHQDWIDLPTLADLLGVKPKSITNAINKRGESIDDITTKFSMSGKTIYKKIVDQTALYQIQ